jgi:hypothetical protein
VSKGMGRNGFPFLANFFKGRFQSHGYLNIHVLTQDLRIVMFQCWSLSHRSNRIRLKVSMKLKLVLNHWIRLATGWNLVARARNTKAIAGSSSGSVAQTDRYGTGLQSLLYDLRFHRSQARAEIRFESSMNSLALQTPPSADHRVEQLSSRSWRVLLNPV